MFRPQFGEEEQRLVALIYFLLKQHDLPKGCAF